MQNKFAEFTDYMHGVWKFAATSKEGQKHTGANGPIAGELFSNRICKNNYTFQLNYISSLNLVIKKDEYNYLNMH